MESYDKFDKMRKHVYEELDYIDYEDLLPFEKDFHSDLMDCFSKYLKNLSQHRWERRNEKS